MNIGCVTIIYQNPKQDSSLKLVSLQCNDVPMSPVGSTYFLPTSHHSHEYSLAKYTHLYLDRNYSICNKKLLISGLGQHSRYSNLLLAGWSRDCILLREKISAPVQISPGAHLLHNGYQVIPEGTVARQGINDPPPSTVKVKGRVELYLYSPSVFIPNCRMNFYFYC